MKRTKAYILFVMIALFTASSTLAQSQEAEPSTTGTSRYVIVLDSDSAFQLTDSLFYSISEELIFPVNKYEIPRNSEFRKNLQATLDYYMSDTTLVLNRLYVRGAASPEGSPHRNRFLAEQRLKALKDVIEEGRHLEMAEPFKVDQQDEDYGYLLLLLKERGDKDYDVVANIVSEWAHKDQQVLKNKLRHHDGGRLWSRLLRDYFPQMRAARIVVVFRKVPRIEWGKVHRLTLAAVDTVVAVPKLPSVAMPPALMPYETPREDTIRHRRELLSIKTNLLFDAALTPNLAIEYYPQRGHFTFGASMDFPWWQNYEGHRYWQIRNYQLEARYYFRSGGVDRVGYGNGPAFRGWYAQAYVHAGLYNICFDADSGYEGEGIGGGLGLGYVLPLGKDTRWRLEFGAQFGFFWTKYDPYQWLCPVDGIAGGEKYFYKWTGSAADFVERQHRFSWLGPTRIGVTLSYDLLYRKRTGKGVSVNRFE